MAFGLETSISLLDHPLIPHILSAINDVDGESLPYVPDNRDLRQPAYDQHPEMTAFLLNYLTALESQAREFRALIGLDAGFDDNSSQSDLAYDNMYQSSSNNSYSLDIPRRVTRSSRKNHNMSDEDVNYSPDYSNDVGNVSEDVRILSLHDDDDDDSSARTQHFILSPEAASMHSKAMMEQKNNLDNYSPQSVASLSSSSSSFRSRTSRSSHSSTHSSRMSEHSSSHSSRLSEHSSGHSSRLLDHPSFPSQSLLHSQSMRLPQSPVLGLTMASVSGSSPRQELDLHFRGI